MCDFYLWFDCSDHWAHKNTTLRAEQNGQCLAENIFKCIFLKYDLGSVCVWGGGGGDIFFKFHRSSLPMGLLIDSVLALVQIMQCLKVMVDQNWAGPVEFDPGQVKIIINYIRREIFWTFLGDSEEILIWNTG